MEGRGAKRKRWTFPCGAEHLHQLLGLPPLRGGLLHCLDPVDRNRQHGFVVRSTSTYRSGAEYYDEGPILEGDGALAFYRRSSTKQ